MTLPFVYECVFFVCVCLLFLPGVFRSIFFYSRTNDARVCNVMAAYFMTIVKLLFLWYVQLQKYNIRIHLALFILIFICCAVLQIAWMLLYIDPTMINFRFEPSHVSSRAKIKRVSFRISLQNAINSIYHEIELNWQQQDGRENQRRTKNSIAISNSILLVCVCMCVFLAHWQFNHSMYNTIFLSVLLFSMI